MFCVNFTLIGGLKGLVVALFLGWFKVCLFSVESLAS